MNSLLFSRKNGPGEKGRGKGTEKGRCARTRVDRWRKMTDWARPCGKSRGKSRADWEKRGKKRGCVGRKFLRTFFSF